MLWTLHGVAQTPLVSGSLCVAIDHSYVDCRGVRFEIDVTRPAAQEFIRKWLTRQQAALGVTVEQQKQGYLELRQRFEKQRVEINQLAALIEALSAARERDGLVESTNNEADLAKIEQKLGALMGLREETAQLRAQMESVLRRVQALEQDRNEMLVYGSGKWRVRLLATYGGEGVFAERHTLHRVGGNVALRLPYPYVAEVYLGGAFLWGNGVIHLLAAEPAVAAKEPPVLEKLPSSLSGGDGEVGIALGYEWRVVTARASAAVRYSNQTERATQLRPRGHGLAEFPILVGGEVRVAGGLSVVATFGGVYAPARRVQAYRYDTFGDLHVASGERLSWRSTFTVGIGYALSIAP